MAIDRTGINSLDAGAPNLRLTGDIETAQAIPIELQKIILQYWIQQGDGSSVDRIEDVPKEFRDKIIQLFKQQSSAQGSATCSKSFTLSSSVDGCLTRLRLRNPWQHGWYVARPL